MKRFLVVGIFAGLLIFGAGGAVNADTIPWYFNFNGVVTNPDWQGENVTTEVTLEGNVATLKDDPNAYLYLPVAAAPGTYTFSFDFQADTAAPSPQSGSDAFPDGFFVSLYFDNFNPSTGSTNGDPFYVLDLYDTGVTPYSSEVTTSGGWTHVRFPFLNSYETIFPVFELNDYDQQSNSTVLIKNVSLVASVPEPSLLLLLVVGIVLFFAGSFPVLRSKRRT